MLCACTDCYYDAADARRGPTCLHMNIDRHGNNRPAAPEGRMASPPPRLASLVCDAGAVLGISTDCSCYYDAAATWGDALLGVWTDCYYDAAAARGGAVPGVSTDYFDEAAAALGGTVPGALVECYNNAAAAWGDTVLGALADCYYHTDAARGGALLVPGFQRPAGAPSRWDVDLPFTGLLLPSQGAGNSWRAVPAMVSQGTALSTAPQLPTSSQNKSTL